MAATHRHPVPGLLPAKALDTGSAVLGTITQERGTGGIARVSVLIWRAMEELVGGNCRVVSVLSHSGRATRLEKMRFAWQLVGMQWRGEVKWILFDHLTLATVQNLVPRSRRAPYAIFLHGVEVWCPLSPRQKRVLRSAAIRIANSHYTARRVAETHPDIGPIEVCQLALLEDTASWAAPHSEALDSGLIQKIGRHAVLIVGRMSSLERYKGHDQLIRAWPLVRRLVPDAQLIITGTGDDVPRFQAAAAETGCGEAILFAGRVSDATLDMLYARAALFAMPGRGEGFGLVYLEAMCHGLPCIAGTEDAAQEVVEQGKTGFLVNPDNIPELAETLIQLLVNPSLRKEMGEAGLRRAKTCFPFDQFKARFASAMAPLLRDLPRRERG
jgi:phosphatidyl-myo-inositol dimannoside synthase